jgi:hypothetical protein
MKRLSALDLQERLRAAEPSVLCVTRRRAPSVDDVVRRLDAAARRLELELFTVDGDDGETAALLPDLGVTMIPCVLVVAGGAVIERQSAIRDGVDARRLVALAAATRATRPPGPAVAETLPPAGGASVVPGSQPPGFRRV